MYCVSDDPDFNKLGSYDGAKGEEDSEEEVLAAAAVLAVCLSVGGS